MSPGEKYSMKIFWEMNIIIWEVDIIFWQVDIITSPFFRQLWYVDFWDVMLTCQIMMSTCQIMTSTCHISIILLLSVWQKLGKNLFLAHLSWKLKAQVSFSDHLSSVVCPSVRPCVCKLFLFSTSSPEQQGQFQPNLAQSILGWKRFKFVQMKGHALFQGK